MPVTVPACCMLLGSYQGQRRPLLCASKPPLLSLSLLPTAEPKSLNREGGGGWGGGRARETDRQRDTDRDREREKQKQAERDTNRETETDRQI